MNYNRVLLNLCFNIIFNNIQHNGTTLNYYFYDQTMVNLNRFIKLNK